MSDDDGETKTSEDDGEEVTATGTVTPSHNQDAGAASSSLDQFESFSLTRGSDSDMLSTSSVEGDEKRDKKVAATEEAEEYVEEWINTLPDDFSFPPGLSEIPEERFAADDVVANYEPPQKQSLIDSEDEQDGTTAVSPKRRLLLRKPATTRSLEDGDTGVLVDLSEDDDEEELIANETETIVDLSQKGLQEVPPSLLKLKHVKTLYLEGNQLTRLPDAFFPCLVHLEWLDLRNNCLKSLPSNIGQHECLKTLLLEGNQLEQLPFQLVYLTSLQGLNYRNNPLRDPPGDVLAKGLKAIKTYWMRKHQLETGRTILTDYQQSSSETTYQSSLSRKSTISTLSTVKPNIRRTRSGLIPYVIDADYEGPTLDALNEKQDEEEQLAARRRDKMEIEEIIQQIKSALALKSWRTKAKIEQLQMSKVANQCPGFWTPELKPPFDVDEQLKRLPTRQEWLLARYTNEIKTRPTHSPGYLDAERFAREREVEAKIRLHLNEVVENSRQEVVDMERAASQLQEVERLRRDLMNLFHFQY